ncbi:hypothetical protein QUF80_14855 [Desulfococcaceae bacterium HSG8]|nr:hypothetical protein [Desulfococcaceae bacterium HSG8]
MLYVVPCQGDALFIHDYKINEYLIGEKDADLAASYTGQTMLIDKNTRYTGSWMKRIFGRVEENRETTHFLLDKDQIRQINWYKQTVFVFPFEKLTDITWIKQQNKADKETKEFLKGRYSVSTPKLTINQLPGKVKVNKYRCRHVEADLRLETRDLKKNAVSITLLKQDLWLSDDVPGLDEYNDFHKNLAKKTGLDAERLGSLSFLLRYWEGSLDPIRESLSAVKGYPVKSLLTVKGKYIKDVGTDSSKTHSFQIKEESVELREVHLNNPDGDRFKVPADFKVTTVANP